MAKKILFIAEKPDMGKKIAQAMSKDIKNQPGHVIVPQGFVSWCVGHLLATAAPEDYKPEWKKWAWNTMPIIPDVWQVHPEDSKKKQIQVIKQLLKQCDMVVNAGDPDREGQVIIDELLEYLNNKKPVSRLLLHALDPATVRAALQNLQPNQNYQSLYRAGVARQRADWLVGMNMTRSYTLLGRAMGKDKVLSVGRVQTPTLAIVVNREREIAGFVPRNFNILKVPINHPAGVFGATWVAQESQEQAGWATHSHIWDAPHAKRLQALLTGKQAEVVDFKTKEAKRSPPMPFELGAMQTYADKKWGYGAQETLNLCQELYEKGFLSYPRTDCTYLPENHHPMAPEILAGIAAAVPAWAQAVAGADVSLKSAAWNDKKLNQHYGLIPTKLSPSNLSEAQQNIYNACAWRYLAQFYHPALIDQNEVEFVCEKEKLVSRGNHIKSQGWLVLQVLMKKPGAEKEDDEDAEELKKEKDGSKEDEVDSGGLLPTCTVKDQYLTGTVAASSGQTKPPAYFTQGSLIAAMRNVYLFVKDPVRRQKLKDIEGIGRPATRAPIIETLLKRGLLQMKSKQIRSTPSGSELIDLVPERLRDPVTTALWETALDGIAANKLSFDDFYAKQVSTITEMVRAAEAQWKAIPPSTAQGKPFGSK